MTEKTALRLLFAAAALAAAVAPASSAPTTPEIDLKIKIAVPQRPVHTGKEGEALVTLTPPSGVHINQYPPIRLTLESNPPVVFSSREIKVGLDKMPENAEENAFHTVAPIRVPFRVEKHDGDGKIPIKGKIRYTYCVARSGYCAPGVKEITFSVPVTAAP